MSADFENDFEDFGRRYWETFVDADSEGEQKIEMHDIYTEYLETFEGVSMQLQWAANRKVHPQHWGRTSRVSAPGQGCSTATAGSRSPPLLCGSTAEHDDLRCLLQLDEGESTCVEKQGNLSIARNQESSACAFSGLSFPPSFLSQGAAVKHKMEMESGGSDAKDDVKEEDGKRDADLKK
eukprot:scaffold635_cov311-Pinguiococcus_pyrenoidosus.AAC.15